MADETLDAIEAPDEETACALFLAYYRVMGEFHRRSALYHAYCLARRDRSTAFDAGSPGGELPRFEL